MKKQSKICFLLLGLCSVLPFSSSASERYGYIEKAMIRPKKLMVKAKLDTGAVLASINAVHVKEFNKGKEKWVRFDIPQEGKNLTLERPLLRYVNIKTRQGEKKLGLFQRHIKRPVVLLSITMGHKTRLIEVNLANRSRFIYPLLLGRQALIAFNASVDPGLTFTKKLKVL
jgi:hypothetical protein